MKPAILITARLKSTRLKKKVLKPILGRPMLSHMIERLQLAKQPQKIIICTSTVAQDDPLGEFASSAGIECFRGHPEDVLLRMRDAAQDHGVDIVISCTADNPFVDPEYIDKLLECHVSEGNDFTYCEGLPFGTFSYALNLSAIQKACKIKDEVDTEVWGGYFTQTGLFKCGILSVSDPKIRHPELRLTVDTQEDFDLVLEVFKNLYTPGDVFSLKEIIDFLKDNPQLLEINANVDQELGIAIKLKEDYRA